MLKRSLAILTLASLLFMSLGLADALHLGHDHDHGDDSSQCQVCYLVKVATIGVAVSIALFIVFDNATDDEPTIRLVRPARVGHGGPQAPRAPPA
ncbi:MAG: hypothetical protein KDA33_07575 [Phycisphaerales bacterium]|nr:hypothetical protein [Phycisphaerales bacterium]